MKLFSRLLHGWAGLIRLPARLTGAARTGAALASLLLVLGLLALLLAYGGRWLPARFWQLLTLCAIALGVLWWFLVGARRFSRRGFARKHIGDLAPGDPAEDEATRSAMQQAIRQARQTIQRSPDIERGRDPLYRIPWLLFIGDADARAEALLRTASPFSPFPAPAPAAEGTAAPIWRWWFFKSMIAIETSPALACEPGERRERGLWYHALLQLSQERDKLPLNGIVVCIGAQTLLDGPQATRSAAMRLRRLVDEALEHLQVQLPVYLVVTGLEALPGYAGFRDVLPAEALAQAMGHCLPAQEAVSAATSARLDDLFDPIQDRLHALRLTALRAQHTPAGRRAVFDFVEAFAALRGGLRTLVQLMLEDNPFQRTPRWRGLYFTASAGPQGAGAFVGDVFTRFLPADQPLASTRLKGRAGRLGIAAIGVAAMLGLSVTLSHGLQGVRNDDSALLAQTRSACREPSDAGAGSRIAWVARCGQTVEKLEAAQAGTGLGFGLRRADRSIDQTRERLLRDFSGFILAPYEQVIEADLARGQAGVEHVLAVAQRLRLLKHCRKRSDACATEELAHNAAFDPHARVFSPFLSGEQDGGSSRGHAGALFTTYLGYLRWQSPGVLDDETRRLEGLLARLWTARPPSVEQIRHWADTRRDALTLRDFWLPADRVVGTDARTQARVDAAFTVDVWQGFVRPMLDTADGLGAPHADTARALRAHYLDAYVQAWGTFAARFHEGQALWHGASAALLARAANPDTHPHRRLDAALQTHVLALPIRLPLSSMARLAWAEARADWLGAWRPLGRLAGQAGARFGGLVAGLWRRDAAFVPAAWVPAWLETRSALRAPAVRDAFARSYLRLSRPDAGAEIEQGAALLFRASAGTPPPPSPGGAQGMLQDYTLLLGAADKPPEHAAARFTPADAQAWSVSQGPVRLLMFLTLQRTAQSLQARWREGVVAPLAALAPGQRREALLGPGGRLAAFLQDWLAPFVSEGERQPRTLAGVGLPLSPAFSALLAADRRYDPASRNRAFAAAHLQFDAPSQFGPLTEGADGTQLDVVCQDRSFRITSRGESLADGRTQVFWAPGACTEVRLRIALPEPPPADGMPPDGSAPPAGDATATRLTLLYQGPDSFPALLRDFGQGARTFRMADFQSSYTPAQWTQVQQRLARDRIAQVRVFLQAVPTPDMKRHLSGAQADDTVPDTIFD